MDTYERVEGGESMYFCFESRSGNWEMNCWKRQGKIICHKWILGD